MKRYWKGLCKYAVLFYEGGSAYLTVEIFCRGYSYRSMFFVGAIAFVLVGGINRWLPWELSFPAQMLIGAVLITAVELVSGLILNIWLGLGIWDYSNLPMNLMGQICLQYSVIWFVLSAVCILLDDYIRYYCCNEEKPRYRLI